MEKSTSQSLLKVLCIAGIILNAIAAILTLSAAIISIIGLNTPGVDLAGAASGTINGQAMTSAQILSLMSVVSVIAGVLYVLNVVACILGLRGANNPSKIKPFYNLVVVVTVLSVIVIAVNAISGDINSGRFFTLIFDIVLLVLANNIKQQA